MAPLTYPSGAMRKVAIVFAFFLFWAAVVVALLPVSAPIPLGGSFTCNAATVRQVNTAGASTAGLSTYASALDVWLHPSVVESPSIGYGNGSEYAILCKSAAQKQVIWAAALFAIGLFLVVILLVSWQDRPRPHEEPKADLD